MTKLRNLVRRIPSQVRVLWGQQAKERWTLVTNDPILTSWEYAHHQHRKDLLKCRRIHG